jgi:hypothetical protein
MPIKPEKGFHENRHEKRLSRDSLFLSSPVVRGLALWSCTGSLSWRLAIQPPTNLPLEATARSGPKDERIDMCFLKLISTLCSAVQPPSQPTCMYPEQWSDPAAIMVNGVPRYPGSYAAQLVRSQPTNRLGAFLDCF